MAKQITALAGFFTSLALLGATAAQAEETPPPVTATPETARPPLDLNLRPSQSQSQYWSRGEVYGPVDTHTPEPRLSGNVFQRSAGDPARSDFAERLRAGEIIQREVGGGSISVRLKGGISIRYKIKF